MYIYIYNICIFTFCPLPSFSLISLASPLSHAFRNSEWIEIGCEKVKSLIGHPRLVSPAAYSVRVSLQKVKADQATPLKYRFDSLVDDMDNITAR